MNAGAGTAREFPWDHVMAMGFGLLRLSPETFWAMTPREFERAMSVFTHNGDEAPRRADLAALMRAFPDIPHNEENAWLKT
ncbi:rcc01693 family protein [Pseudaminobacter salicylatoxidans]|uniref:rcc01693 family protein n=1 Tax=Pseudaminobacter salicylatoxidans TaxID=93369 RepID=UPI00031AE982|nr:rcc01693 family protein [Pseudaminobacter salicylatoxidans]